MTEKEENGRNVSSRKTATALKLVNWSRFQNEIFRMEGSTLITGVNGTGKSTVLDAMTYLLTGNRQFNKAANDRDRSVLSYVRGDTRSEGTDRYLRSGEVTSYVLMEFWSPADESYLTAGVCVESPDEHNCKTGAWFLCRDTALSDVEVSYIREGSVHVHTRSNLLVKGKRLKSRDFYGMETGTERILRALGMRNSVSKYRSGLLKMMAFRPENNIDKFIQECVLDPGKMNSLTEIRTQRAQFDEIRAFYDQLRRGKEELEKLESLTREYEKREHQLEIRTLMEVYQRLPILEQTMQQLEKERRDTENRLGAAAARIRTAEENLEQARTRLSAAESDAGFQDFRQTLQVLEQEQKDCARRTEEAASQEKELEKLARTLGEILSWAPAESRDRELLASVSVRGESGEKMQAFARIAEAEKNWEEEKNREKVHLEDAERQDRQQLQETAEEIRRLRANQIVYPAEALRARDILRQELEKQGIVTEVRFLAELVKSFRDLKWRRAIETFLGGKRYHLIVDGKYCMQAAEILRAKKLYRSKVVITDRLPDTEVQAGSAAAQLEIPNRFARRYANYLLNGIFLCSNMEELHAHPKGALMQDGTLAKSYAVSLMETGKTRLCMGQDVVKIQLAEREKEYRALTEKLEAEKQQQAQCSTALQQLRRVKWDISAYHFDAPENLYQEKQKAKELKADMDAIRKNPDFMAALQEQEKARRLYNRAAEEKDRAVAREATLKEEQKNRESTISQKKREYREAKENYEAARQDHLLIEEEMQAEYRKAATPEKPEVVTYGNLNRVRNQRDTAMNEMLRQQGNYCRTAGIDNSHTGVSFIPFFRDQYKDTANVKIEEVKNQIDVKSKELESAFMTDFVGELNESIQKAQDEIEIINRELKSIPFGQDTYRFKMEPRPDRDTFFRIRRKLGDYMESPEVYMNSNRDDEEMEHYIRDFMDRILAEEDESEYTDYRKYFTYDMEITSHQGVSVARSSLSRKQGSASNGEKQTPYFIILAASLMQFYPRDSICERLAFIDEAFSALSQERIEQMVKYLEENHFQVIYAAPPEKIGSIGEHVSTTVTLALAGRYTKPVEGMVQGEEI